MRHAWHSLILTLAVLAAGCAGGGMIPTPNLYLQPARRPFSGVAPQFQTSAATVIYATDRLAVGPDSDREPRRISSYGSGRSMALAVGACTVRFGRDLSWPQLVGESTAAVRWHNPAMSVSEIREAARFAATPYAWNLTRNPQYTPEIYDAENARARQALNELLAHYFPDQRPKEVLVYIHGYNANFSEEAGIVAQLWHFLGRSTIPILYTWPAGRGGLRGYSTDTESGEFSIHHLKEFLLALSASPAVARIHIVSHSRGTDILSAALRELTLQLACEGGEAAKARLKLGQVVMAAPDMDTQVFLQRFIAEQVDRIADGFTFYVSATDRALALSRWLHGGAKRLGLVQEIKTTPAIERMLGSFSNVSIIVADVKTDFLGHEFVYTNAAVSSDLILLIRDGRPPGAEHGRPLQKLGPNAWKIVQSYPD